MSARRLLLAELHRGAGQVPRRRRAGRARCRVACPPAARPRRRDARDGRRARRPEGRAGAAASSAAPATASRATAAPACRSRCSATRRGAARAATGERRGALRPRSQSVRLLVVAPDDARERRPEPQLPRLPRRAAAQRRATTSSPHRSCRRPGRRTPPRSSGSTASSPSTARRALQQAISGGQYHHPQGLFYGGVGPTWSQSTVRQVLREHGAALQPPGLDRSAHRPRTERPRRAHLRRPRRRDQRRARTRLVGRCHVDLRRLVDLGAADRDDVAGRLRGMPAGRVHRHRARVRHACRSPK